MKVIKMKSLYDEPKHFVSISFTSIIMNDTTICHSVLSASMSPLQSSQLFLLQSNIGIHTLKLKIRE